jgi:hypothetical protein
MARPRVSEPKERRHGNGNSDTGPVAAAAATPAELMNMLCNTDRRDKTTRSSDGPGAQWMHRNAASSSGCASLNASRSE